MFRLKITIGKKNAQEFAKKILKMKIFAVLSIFADETAHENLLFAS